MIPSILSCSMLSVSMEFIDGTCVLGRLVWEGVWVGVGWVGEGGRGLLYIFP